MPTWLAISAGVATIVSAVAALVPAARHIVRRASLLIYTRLRTRPDNRGNLSPGTHQGVVLADASLETLRERSGLRPMLREENDLPLGELPNGIYGFTTAWSIEPYASGDASRSDYDAVPLATETGGTAVVELHKRSDGQTALVGYVTPDELVALRNPSRRSRLDVVLRLAPDGSRTAVSIPLALLGRARNRQIEGAYVLDLGAVPLR